MARQGPETKLVKKMRDTGRDKYGERLVTVKYHGSEFGEAGVSDLLCVLDGVFVAIEVKAPETYGGSVERALEKGPTLKQRAFVKRIVAAGGVGGFAASVEQFMSLLAEAEEVSRNRSRVTISGEHQTGEDHVATKDKGMIPGAHPAAPGGMSQPQLVAELIRDTDLTKEQAESLTWPQKIEAVKNSRAEIERRYKIATGKKTYDGADLSTFVADEAAGKYNDTLDPEPEPDDAEDDDNFSDLDWLMDDEDEPDDIESLLDDYDPVPSLVARGVMSEPEPGDETDSDLDDPDLDDIESLLAEMDDARAEDQARELRENPPLFIGMPDVKDYIFDGHKGAGPSASSRWMSCTASLEASRSFLETMSPVQQRKFARANLAARQGTTAHLAAEAEANMILGVITEEEAESTLLELATEPDDGEFYDEEMGEYITEYVDLVRTLAESGREVVIEARLTALVPLTGMREGEIYEITGSGDCVGFPSEAENRLAVVDLKYGNGIDVAVEENSQARIYGLGALTLLMDDEGNLPDIESVDYYIVQPRLGGIKMWSESVADLIAWRDEVLAPALTAALGGVDEGAQFAPSESACQFCPARGGCAALAEQRMEQAVELFDFVFDADHNDEPINPAALSSERLGSLLDQISGLVSLHADLKEEAQRRLHRGEEVPGRHLVSYTPKREWAEGAEEKLKRLKKVWKEPVLMTPTQALVVVDKDPDAKQAVEALVNAPAKRPVISTGPNDKRKAWVGRDPEDMFDDLPEEG